MGQTLNWIGAAEGKECAVWDVCKVSICFGSITLPYLDAKRPIVSARTCAPIGGGLAHFGQQPDGSDFWCCLGGMLLLYTYLYLDLYAWTYLCLYLYPCTYTLLLYFT